MGIIERGANRYQQFQQTYKRHFGSKFRGRLLDFGCGAGGFVVAALRDDIDVLGVEVDEQRGHQYVAYTKSEPRAAERLRMYSGRLLPFPSNHFDGVYSFFVFEHVTDPQTSLREIARVLRPGGTLHIDADDVRNAWDGHAKAPWPPYLPREFAAAYLEGLGLPEYADFITSSVGYISAPMIADILSTLGMEIIYQTQVLRGELLREGLYVMTEEAAWDLGNRIKGQGNFTPPSENLRIIAQKT